jgi:putative DNA primase/helicase
MRGPAKGSAIMLDPADAVTIGLHIAEGLGSAMAARVLGFRPVWAAGSAGGIESFPVLAGVETLTVLCENDDGGANARAADACGDRWQAAGRDVFLAEPQICGDMATVLARVTP